VIGRLVARVVGEALPSPVDAFAGVCGKEVIQSVPRDGVLATTFWRNEREA
jgi:hypothetical protein